MSTIVPSSLPDIDVVEVVSLRGLHPKRVSEYMSAAKNARCARLIGSEAEQVATMWRALPGGKKMRCHVPPFGIRFFNGEKLLCEVSICWKCNNIFGSMDGNQFFFEFNGSNFNARKLLNACETALGESALE